MKPCTFDQVNAALTGGPATRFNTSTDVDNLSVYRGGGEVISCWRSSFMERLRILFTGLVWLRVCGNTHPTVSVEGKSPFTNEVTMHDTMGEYYNPAVEKN